MHWSEWFSKQSCSGLYDDMYQAFKARFLEEEGGGFRVETRYVDKDQLAKYWQLSWRTINSFMNQGMPHLRIGNKSLRFDLKECDEWLQRFRVKQWKKCDVGRHFGESSNPAMQATAASKEVGSTEAEKAAVPDRQC